MKNLKSIVLFAGLAFITMNTSARSKSTMTPAQIAQKETDKVKKNVTGVTADQASRILTVEQDHAQACSDAKTASNGDKVAFNSKKKQLCDSRDAKIKTILTSDQYTQYMSMENAKKVSK